MKYLLVGGRFDENGGRSSGVVSRLHQHLSNLFASSGTALNGGSWNALEQAVGLAGYYDAVIWMPDVDNSFEKLLGRIKQVNPKVMLVTSKNNLDGKYVCHDLIARALEAKANLLLEFTRKEAGFAATLLDPLGNCFCATETDLEKVSAVLAVRLRELAAFSRIGSRQVSEERPVPEMAEFFAIIRARAETFHELIHAANASRFLGNASFRCENGFPSFRQGGLVYVSKRNVDKRLLGSQAFVAVNPFNLDTVEYCGSAKPSVDTPVQLRLYSYYRQVTMMLHSHAYIEGAPFTDVLVPCGAIEEAAEIIALCNDPQASNFAINLRGHGSLVLARDTDYLAQVNYYARPLPEPV